MWDSHPNQTAEKPNQSVYPLLEMTKYINELFSVNQQKIIDQSQTISQLKKLSCALQKSVDAQGQTITELKSKVVRLVGPLQPGCPPPAPATRPRLQTPPPASHTHKQRQKGCECASEERHRQREGGGALFGFMVGVCTVFGGTYNKGRPSHLNFF